MTSATIFSRQVYLPLYLSLPLLFRNVSLKGWLFQVARNRCLDELCRRREVPRGVFFCPRAKGRRGGTVIARGSPGPPAFARGDDREQRPGAPATFSFEQFMQIMALACETPISADRPVSSWTPRELADEAVKRGIGERMRAAYRGALFKR